MSVDKFIKNYNTKESNDSIVKNSYRKAKLTATK